MKKTFKEKAVFAAARITKKSKLLYPAVYLCLGVVLGAYGVLRHFFLNGKKYITVAVALVFFFMSSSFTSSDRSADSNIYLDAVSIETEEAVTELTVVSEEPVTEEIVESTETSSDSGEYLVDVDAEYEETDAFSIEDVKRDIKTVEEDDTAVFDKNAWYLILVNKTHPIPEDYKVPLATITGRMQCDERVLGPLLDMLDAAKKDGVSLYVTSPYRSGELQQDLFDRRIEVFMKEKGFSYTEAYKSVSKKVIVPGTSEHQLGMCFDIVTPGHTTLDYEFGNTPGGKWLKKHSPEYGFILRYPKGKEKITGIDFEPWHFRYVGIEAAQYITEHGITLEEFLEDL
ncbi:MAG: M15 family metallopeptidase [Lachnospiraceae bacterium]|nr:M15 family metallopeptidase [Lachnospiraceae bacterium]